MLPENARKIAGTACCSHVMHAAANIGSFLTMCNGVKHSALFQHLGRPYALRAPILPQELVMPIPEPFTILQVDRIDGAVAFATAHILYDQAMIYAGVDFRIGSDGDRAVYRKGAIGRNNFYWHSGIRQDHFLSAAFL
jgi:hypothetical protein